MALLESIDIPLGTPMPSFTLKDPYGVEHQSAKLIGSKGFLLVVTCNHCPYAKAVWPRVIRLASYGSSIGINTAAVNPNIHPDYPDDAPAVMKQKIKEWGITFPYLVDEKQEIARALKAQCTPDIYLFNKDQKLVYHGRIDDNWQDESKVKSEELKTAMANLAEGKPVPVKQYPSMGCSIKWKKIE